MANFAQGCRRADGFGVDQAVQDRGLATGDGPFISEAKLRYSFDPFAMAAKRACVVGEIGVLKGGGADAAARIVLFLVHAYRAVHAVVDQHDHDGQLVY